MEPSEIEGFAGKHPQSLISELLKLKTVRFNYDIMNIEKQAKFITCKQGGSMKKLLVVLATLLLFLTACNKDNEAGDKSIYSQFAEKLEKQTMENELDWDTVFKVTHMYDVDKFNMILFTNEFHTIDELNSYGIATEGGLSVFLLNEVFESGKDGSISEEKNLYIVKGVEDESFELPLTEQEITKLETKIKKYVAKKYEENLNYTGPEIKQFDHMEKKSFDELITEYILED